MKRSAMNTWATLAAVLLVPLPGLAWKVAIVPPVFEQIQAQTQPNDNSLNVEKQIETAVIAGAKEAEFEIVSGSVVDKGIKTIADADSFGCRQQPCLKRLAAWLRVDTAISASVEYLDELSFNVTIASADQSSITKKSNAGFYLMLSDVRLRVAVMLLKTRKLQNESVPAPAAYPVDKTANKTERDFSPTPFSPTPFYVGLAVTGTLAVSWGIIEVLVYQKYNDLNKGKWPDQDYWENAKQDTRTYQITERVVFGAMLASAITTGVLLALTDFDNDHSMSKGIKLKALAPAMTASGAEMIVQWRF